MTGIGTGTPIAQSAPGRGLTTTDLIARVRDLVAEATPDYYEDAEILGYLNEGKSRMFAHLDVLPRQLDIDLAPGQEVYRLDEIVARFEHVSFSGRTQITPVTSEEFARLKMTAATGAPRYYCPEFLTSRGEPAITLYPVPDALYPSGLQGVYYAEPPDLVLANNTVIPPLPGVDPNWHVPYHALPSYYAASVLLRKDRLRDQAHFEEQRFFAGVEEYRRWYERKFPRRVRSTHAQGVRSLPATEVETWPFEIGV